MSAKITIENDKDNYGNWRVILQKKYGEFKLKEIMDLLRYEEHGKYQGLYAIIINASEDSCFGSGYDDGTNPKGDMVELYEIADGESCPVCRAMLSYPDYSLDCDGQE